MVCDQQNGCMNASFLWEKPPEDFLPFFDYPLELDLIHFVTDKVEFSPTAPSDAH